LKAVQHGLSHNREPIRAPNYARPTAVPIDSAEAPPAVSSYGIPGSPETPGSLNAGAAYFTPSDNAASISFDLPLREARDAFERAYFEYHLIRENSSMTRVAERTGLERTHLYRKLKQLGVEPGKLARKN
jgi:DNA-binding NtrC family response regulator